MYTRTDESINEVAKTLRGVEARVAGVTDDSVVDGPGLRMTVFFAGCRPKYTTTTGQVIHCPGCHNLAIQALNSGQSIALDDLIVCELVKIDLTQLGQPGQHGQQFLGRQPQRVCVKTCAVSGYFRLADGDRPGWFFCERLPMHR